MQISHELTQSKENYRREKHTITIVHLYMALKTMNHFGEYKILRKCKYVNTYVSHINVNTKKKKKIGASNLIKELTHEPNRYCCKCSL